MSITTGFFFFFFKSQQAFFFFFFFFVSAWKNRKIFIWLLLLSGAMLISPSIHPVACNENH